MNQKIKKIGKTVATSALLVGATLTGAAGFAAAQSSGSSGDLGDYPQPFVGEDGNVQSTIVVGESAKTIDVVGAVNIAGSLGNSAFKTEEKTVSVSGTQSFRWGATEGTTLDTVNDQLYLGDKLDSVRDSFTNEQLETLEDTTFEDDDGDDTDIENFLYPGNQTIQFGKPNDRSDQDPVMYVDSPADPSATDHLFRLQADFEDQINFTADDVQDEEIRLFGNDYTVSTDSKSDKLILFGSKRIVTIDSGEKKTITVNDNEHTIEVVGVTSSDTAAFKVDGSLREEDEDDEFSLSGQTIRVDEVIQTNSDQSEGTVEFGIGSQELKMQDGNDIQDEDDDDIEGAFVTFDGSNSDGDNGVVDELSGINVYIGSGDDDMEYLTPAEEGGSYTHPNFPDYKFSFMGLNPDAGAEDAENIADIDFKPSGDDTVTVDYTSSAGDSGTVEFLHDDDVDTDGLNADERGLADDDNDAVRVIEGTNVSEDEYFVSDAGDFSHMWEVTNIDVDEADLVNNGQSSDEATVDLQEVVGDDKVEVDLDSDNRGSATSENEYTGTEVIDGQTYSFVLYTQGTSQNSDDQLTPTWGSTSDLNNTGDRTTLFAAQDVDSEGAVAFGDNLTVSHTNGNTVTYELPSTESTDAAHVDVTYDNTDTNSINATVGNNVQVTNDANTFVTVEVNGGVDYNFTNDGADQIVVAPNDGSGTVTTPSGIVLEPEDDNDEEHGYLVTNGYDSNDNELTVSSGTYTGSTDPGVPVGSGTTPRFTATLESDDDITAGYDFFGSYTWFDTDDQQQFMVKMPEGQATAGAGVTTQDGEVTSSGGGSGTVETSMPAGWPDAAALDSDSNVGQLKNNQNLILVGGPAVNNLVSELANANKTWSASQYTEGQGMVQMIEDAFSEGNDALVVAGYAGEDTRAASNFIADYADHQSDLSGEDQVTVSTAEGTVVQ